jgi:hypothetical protein
VVSAEKGERFGTNSGSIGVRGKTMTPGPTLKFDLSLARFPLRVESVLKACRQALLTLAGLFIGQAAVAESQPVQLLNRGFNDAWFNPATPGQGFLLTVLPDQQRVFLAWFTFDTERPLEDVSALLGEPGHRWLTAQGGYESTTANLTIFVTEGGIFDSSEPVPSTNPAGDGSMTIEFSDCSEGLLTYQIDSLGIQGEIPIQRVVPYNIALCETLAAQDPNNCTRPPIDESHGPDDPKVVNGAIIDRSLLLDGGPGPDGIPPLERPGFLQDAFSANLATTQLVVGVKIGDDVRAYPHNILNWHEVVNDLFIIGGEPKRTTLNYCPLTGTGMLWQSLEEPGDETWGTSGILFNSNLVMYDRKTGSFWSQMLEQAIQGSQVTKIPERLQAVETTWGTWRAMYPQTAVLSANTGFSRNYAAYPYGSFREDQSVLFPVNNADDRRLHRKERVLGINIGDNSKVYPISRFESGVEVINQTVGDMNVVVAGSSGSNFGVVFNRELEDCTVMEFEAVQDRLPVVMRDTRGNEWDIFGVAVSGPRNGQQLQKTNSYIAYWYAWTAFFPDAVIQP